MRRNGPSNADGRRNLATAKFLRGPHMATVEEHIEQASAFGQRLERQSPVRDQQFLTVRILALVRNKFYGGAFALLRPVVEAEVHAHVVLMASEEIAASIKDDTYKTNFKKVGGEIDAAFGLEGFFDRYLSGAKGALHSFTHSGLSQLGRRFNGSDIDASYSDGETIEVMHNAGNAAFMVTNLVAKHFKLEDEAKAVNDLFLEWGKL